MNFFLVDDSPTVVREVSALITHIGHNLVQPVCNNLEEVVEAITINSGILQKEKIHIAIIDGYFPSKKGKVETELLGPEVEIMLRKIYPEIKTIAHTSTPEEHVKYGDIYANKINMKSLRIAISKMVDLIQNPQT